MESFNDGNVAVGGGLIGIPLLTISSVMAEKSKALVPAEALVVNLLSAWEKLVLIWPDW